MMQLSVPFLLFFCPQWTVSSLSLFPSFYVLQCDISPMLENGNWLQTTTARLPLMLNSLLKFYMSLTSLSGSGCCCRVMNSDWLSLHCTSLNTTQLCCDVCLWPEKEDEDMEEYASQRPRPRVLLFPLSNCLSLFQCFSVSVFGGRQIERVIRSRGSRNESTCVFLLWMDTTAIFQRGC